MNFSQFVLQNHTEILELTLEHLWLVAVSTVLAVLIGIPLGILITRRPALNKPVLGAANVIQTIPSLALFGFLLPAPWIGARADRLAILALTLYALLPLIRNTYTGIKGVDRAIIEAGRGMGMTDSQLLWQVELPLALGVIIAGVRVATVISVGLATIAAAIGAGGLGEYIFRGLAMVNDQLILGEIISQQIEAKTHLAVERRFYLAGSYICHQAILGGRIDIYPEYTGTALTAILKQKPEGNREAVYQRVKSEYAKRFNLSV